MLRHRAATFSWGHIVALLGILVLAIVVELAGRAVQ
jgi:hypothetical protein